MPWLNIKGSLTDLFENVWFTSSPGSIFFRMAVDIGDDRAIEYNEKHYIFLFKGKSR